MAAENSLNQSMNMALKHYSSLFFLPKFKKSVIGLAILCIGGGGLSSIILFPSIAGAINGFLLGLSFFSVNLFFDYVVSNLILGQDPIYVLRRTVALSLFCWIIWLFFVVLGVTFAILFDISWWVKLCLFGFSAVLTFRFVVFLSSSSMSDARKVLASLAQPFPCLVPFVIYWATTGYVTTFEILPFLALAPMICFISSFSFISLLDRMGQKMLGISSMSLFKAFLLNWVAGLNTPFEEFLEALGQEQDVDVSLLKFDSSRTKAAIIVPSVHPGPFKNIGSSLLPSMLKHDFEKEYGCDACVPLGILGHELDLASQPQNQKIITYVINSAKFKATEGKATPFIRVTEGYASASCQIFGNNALLSFTLAPKTTEDLPQELGQVIRQEAEKRGIACSIVVNAHNSMDEETKMEESFDILKEVAVKCLERATSLKALPFEVGAATIMPKEFGLKDGMGPGGITAVAVKVAEQKNAYVVLDGNNMVSGLREKILSALNSMGYDESEVFTTDTHVVSAIILGSRGYHPIGEAMDTEKLIGYIKDAAKAAMDNMERCKAGCLCINVPKVKVIGKARLESLSLLTDRTLHKAKKLVLPIFALTGLFLMLLLLIF